MTVTTIASLMLLFLLTLLCPYLYGLKLIVLLKTITKKTPRLVIFKKIVE